MKHHIRGIVRHAAGVAVLTALVAACSGSSDGAGSDVTTPLEETPAVAISEPPATLEPVVTEPPVTEPVAEEVVIPDVPCDEYVEEAGYPLKPCDSGVLTETLQRDLVSLFPGIAIDGLFGGQTFGFVKEFQTSIGLEATGLVSEELATQISTAESLGTSQPAADQEADAPADDGAVTDEELCNGLIGNPDDPNFTAEQIEACSELGVDIVGEG